MRLWSCSCILYCATFVPLDKIAFHSYIAITMVDVRTTFISATSSDLQSLELTRRVHDVKLSIFPSWFFDKKKVSLGFLPRKNKLPEYAYLTTTIFISLCPGSTYIYPTCRHNSLLLLPFSQTYSVNTLSGPIGELSVKIVCVFIFPITFIHIYKKTSI